MNGLVVIASDTVRRIMVNALRSAGVTSTIEARDGTEAMEKFQPDVRVLITDWNMPRMDGIALVKYLRGNAPTDKLPILMVTSRSSREDVAEAIAAGVNGYLLKPFDQATLTQQIELLLERASATQPAT